MTSGVKIIDVEDRKAKIIHMISSSVNGSFTHACKAAGISRQQGYDWVHEDPQFKVDLDKARRLSVETGLDYVESQLMKAVRDGNVTAMIFYLKCQGKERGYIDRQMLSFDKENPLNVTVEHDASNEFRKILSTLALAKATSGSIPLTLDQSSQSEPGDTAGGLASVVDPSGAGMGQDTNGG